MDVLVSLLAAPGVPLSVVTASVGVWVLMTVLLAVVARYVTPRRASGPRLARHTRTHPGWTAVACPACTH